MFGTLLVHMLFTTIAFLVSTDSYIFLYLCSSFGSNSSILVIFFFTFALLLEVTRVSSNYGFDQTDHSNLYSF